MNAKNAQNVALAARQCEGIESANTAGHAAGHAEKQTANAAGRDDATAAVRRGGLNPKFCVNSQRGENRAEFNVRGSGFIRLPLVCSITPAGMDVKGGGKAAVHRSAAQRRADP